MYNTKKRGEKMKKFNLFNEIIVTDKNELLNAINSSKEFSITTDGKIEFAPYNPKGIYIYRGKNTPAPISAMSIPKPFSLSDFFGTNYQIVEDNQRVLIKAFSNWQELIGINTPNASYDDTTADGVAEFSNKKLEDIGWHITEFDVRYRELVEVLEEKCTGTVLCIEQEEPYQFSGLGFLADDEEAFEILYNYCQNIAKDKIQNDKDFAPEELDDDQEEAAKFFKLL
jgi:hypothetical protein